MALRSLFPYSKRDTVFLRDGDEAGKGGAHEPPTETLPLDISYVNTVKYLCSYL